jgi:hypothetical protein
MRRFYFVGFAAISILCCCTFLFAQEKAKYQEFVEAEIVLTDTLSIADIEALPKAPGSSIEILDDGSTVRVQIPAATAQELAGGGAQITTVRSFLLVQAANSVSPAGPMQTIASIYYEYGENDSDVDIPADGSFAGSAINLTSFPASIIIGVDVHYEIESSWTGYVYAELSDYPETKTYSLVSGVNGSINQTKTGITTFNGMSLNRRWILWASEDYSSGDGFIDYWWIKLYCDSGSSYCAASALDTGFEHISRVIVGSIDNSTGSSGYADYTSLSTLMEIGTGYPITVTNGYPYSTDGCKIRVDWNQDKDFDDAGEAVSMSGSPGVGPYTATITPPAYALAGNTRMRIRVVDTNYDSLLPCGTTTYGEVEDYTINVADSAPPTLKVSGYITHRWDDSPVSGVLLEIYNGSGAGTPTGLTDISDVNGYYEIEVPSPWTGHVKATKNHYGFSWGNNFTNVTTDQIQDFSAYYTYSGGFGSSGSPYLIATAEDMNAIGSHPEDWGQYFKMTADIDLSDYTGTQFKIIGTSSTNAFAGVFDGNNHTISNFGYSTQVDVEYIGLFGYVKGGNAQIKNLVLVDPNVVAREASDTGTLVGLLDAGTVLNCHVYNGRVNGFWAGGLVGENNAAIIDKSCFSGTVTGAGCGGLVAMNRNGIISECYSNGSVTGNGVVGGLAAENRGVSNISNCYSVCDVGIGGEFTSVGGLVGYNHDSTAKIYRCYSSGKVLGTGSYTGGFIGYAPSGTFTDCFLDFESSGYTDPVGSGSETGIFVRTTGQMQTKSTFTSAYWDFANDWKICDGTNYPKLLWQQSLAGDFACPDGVDFIDYSVLAKQWMLEKLSYDVAPAGGNGIVNFLDWAVFANSWQGNMIQLSEFMSQWLQPGMYNADIAPVPDGDGIVNTLDFAAFAENWLKNE